MALGFEPRTACLEGRCSIQLSYATIKSGWQDSNLRPPRPKRGAITGLRYTPKRLSLAERVGFEPTRQLPVDSLANCSINHSGTSPILIYKNVALFSNADANVTFHLKERKLFFYFFTVIFLFRIFYA